MAGTLDFILLLVGSTGLALIVGTLYVLSARTIRVVEAERQRQRIEEGEESDDEHENLDEPDDYRGDEPHPADTAAAAAVDVGTVTSGLLFAAFALFGGFTAHHIAH